MSWNDCELGEVLTLKRGYDLPTRLRKNGSVPVVSSSGITGHHNEAKVPPPTVVTGRYGTLGNVYYVDRECWPLNTALYVVDFKDTHPRFAAYFLRNVLRDYRSDKAAVPGVDRNVLHRFSVRVPDYSTQTAIATTLSAYDDLIDNNQRRIQLLERAARLLYREWFVHLRFPGHGRIAITDGLPEGWERTTALDVMDVLSGGTPRTTVRRYWDGDIPFFTPKDASDCVYAYKTARTLTHDGLRNCNSRLFRKDTVFITARGTVGKTYLAQTDMAMSQSCYGLMARPPLNQPFLFFALREAVDEFRSRAVGSVFGAIVRDTFSLIPFLVPVEAVIERFSGIVRPMLHQIDMLLQETHLLTQGRDLLLPRLMSGEIKV